MNYQLRVRDLQEALQREDPDSYVRIEHRIEYRGKDDQLEAIDHETESMTGIDHRFDGRRTIVLK